LVLKVQRTGDGEVVFAVSGRLYADNLRELAAVLDAAVALDLTDLILADADAIRFLCDCERGGIELRNCPPYIRTWIARERGRS
jgi:hypothetical protein